MIITEKNVDMIAGKLERFFRPERYFREWHNFRGGMKPRIKHNYVCGQRIENYYGNIAIRRCPIAKEGVIIDMTENDHDVFSVGDVILFKGNRIIHRSRTFASIGKYCYTCYQIVAPSEPDYAYVVDEATKYAESSKYYADMYYEDYAEYCDRFDDESADAEDEDFDPEDDDGPEMGYDLDPARDFQCFDLPPEAHYGPIP